MPRHLSVWLVLALLAGCDSAGDTGASPTATESARAARQRVFVYEVRGKARGVEITFVDEDGRTVRRRVDAPWTSREIAAPADARLRLTARGPAGSYLKCVLNHRRASGRFGGNGSGEWWHVTDSPRECDIDNPTAS